MVRTSDIMDTPRTEKKFAVIKFPVDNTYATCSQQHKATGSASYFVGSEVSIQWAKNEVYTGVVVFTDGK